MPYPTKKLGEICKVQKGKKPQLFDVQTKTRLPYLVAKFMRGTKDALFAEIDDKNSVPTNADDLIIICDGSKSGDVFSGFRGILSSTMGRVDFDKKQIERVYLELFLKINFDLFNSNKKGAAIPHLDFTIFNNLETPLPPLSEQKKIVAKLESLLGKISEAKKLRAKAQEAAQNFLPAELHKIFSEGKKKDWEEKELGGITRVVTGNTPKTHMAEYYDDKYLWARPGDLNERLVMDTEKKLSQVGFEEGGIRPIPVGSVMMCCIGSIGKIGIASEEMATNQQINSFVPDIKKIDGKFLFYSLIYLREKFITGASSTTLKIINKSRCEKIKIPLPPLAEQKKIVARLDSLSQKIQAVKELQNTTDNEFNLLERSLLQQAFTEQARGRAPKEIG